MLGLDLLNSKPSIDRAVTLLTTASGSTEKNYTVFCRPFTCYLYVNLYDHILYCARFLRRLAEPEEFQIGQVKIDDERVSDELLMSSNL